MNRLTRIFLQFFCLPFLLIACADKTGSSNPFGELLAKAPYAALTDSLKKEPKRDDIYFRRAVLLNTNQLPEPALADFRKAWSLNKKEEYALGTGSLLLELKSGEAIDFLQEATAVLPESLLLNLTLARALEGNGKTQEALQLCTRLLAFNPEQVDLLKMKAGLLEKTNDTQQAVSLLEKAYTLTPYDIELNYFLALKYAETRNPRVLRLCDSLIKVDTLGVHGDAYYYKGVYYSNTGNRQAALAQFDEAIRHDYYFLDGYIEKGALLFEMNKYKEALAVFNLALTISPKNAENYYWIAKCQQALGQREEAKLNYQRAWGLDQSFTAARDSADKLK